MSTTGLAEEKAPAYSVSGLTGSTAASRWCGATTSGAPTTGAHLVGDFVVAQNGNVWVCTAAGTPGTWVGILGADLVSTQSVGGAKTFTSLLTASAGITVPSGQALTTGTRSVVTGTRATTTNASDTVDLGTFSTTGGAIELRIHASLAAPAAGTTASVTKVFEFAANATLGTLNTWYTLVPADSSQAQAATNDFDLEVRRSAANTFDCRFRQKTIGAANAVNGITFTIETLGDTVVTFTPSSAITAAPAAATNFHPSNPMGLLAGDTYMADGTTLRTVPRGVVAETHLTANSAQNITSATQTTITGTASRDNATPGAGNLDVTYSVIAGHKYEITALINLFSSVAADVVRAGIAVTAGGTNGTFTTPPQPAWTLPTASRADSRTIIGYFYATTSGSVTFAAQSSRVAGTGNVNAAGGSAIALADVGT